MLKGIPNTISPDLMHALMSTGHGDEIVATSETALCANLILKKGVVSKEG
jgi:L-fucose mutarotase/ribose pyranase (RbsD/FucU family)